MAYGIAAAWFDAPEIPCWFESLRIYSFLICFDDQTDTDVFEVLRTRVAFSLLCGSFLERETVCNQRLVVASSFEESEMKIKQ